MTATDTEILDFSAHFHPEEVFPEPLRKWGVAKRVGSPLHDFSAFASVYEQSGYDGAVVSQPFYMGHGDVNIVRTANDALLEVITEEENFYGLAAIPVSAGGQTAADEFKRCLKNGYHGGGIETRTNGIELTDPELRPVFEVAETHDAPLMVHPKLHDSLHTDAFADGYLLNATFGREAALCESICKTIYISIPEKYPDMNLVYHHTGGNIASMLGRIELHLRSDWWPGQENLPSLSKFRTMLNRIHVDTAGFMAYRAPMEAALEIFPPENVVLGTDWPFEARSVEDMEKFLTVARDLTSEPDTTRVLGGNTKSLLTNV